MRKVSFLMGLIAILPFIVVADHEPVPGTTDFDLYTDSHLQWLDDRCADPAELDPNAANTLAAFCIARESAVRKALHDLEQFGGGSGGAPSGGGNSDFIDLTQEFDINIINTSAMFISKFNVCRVGIQDTGTGWIARFYVQAVQSQGATLCLPNAGASYTTPNEGFTREQLLEKLRIVLTQ